MTTTRAPLFAALTLALSVSGGCKSDPEPAATSADAKAEAGAPTGKAEAGAPTGAGAPTAKAEGGEAKPAGDEKQVVALDPKELERLKMMSSEVAKHLDAGSAAADSENWAEAVKEFDLAVKLDEDNPHIHAALGWAQFNSKDLKGAEHNFRIALRFEREDTRRADYLYKLGRVEEEKGDWVSAKKHYDHSLRIKDNKEAREHDDEVTTKAEAKCKDGSCDKPDFVDLKAACEAMRARVHDQLGLVPHDADEEFSCNHESAKRIPMSGGDATEAVILKITGEHGLIEEEEHDLLVHIEGGWHWVGTVLDIENPHKDGILRSGKLVSFEAKELIPSSPGTEVIVQVELQETDADLDDNIAYHDEHEAYIVCGINKNTHVCHEIPTFMLFEAEQLDVSRPAAHDTETHQFKATAVFDGKGNVTVTGEGEVPEEEKGTHQILELPEPHGFVFLHED